MPGQDDQGLFLFGASSRGTLSITHRVPRAWPSGVMSGAPRKSGSSVGLHQRVLGKALVLSCVRHDEQSLWVMA